MFAIQLHTKTAKAKQIPSRQWSQSMQPHATNKRVVGKKHTTGYHRPRLAESIHSACMKVVGFSGEAELTALKVCEHVEAWLENKYEVTEADIRRTAAAALRKYNPRAAYEYLPTKDYALRKDQYGFIRL